MSSQLFTIEEQGRRGKGFDDVSLNFGKCFCYKMGCHMVKPSIKEHSSRMGSVSLQALNLY